MIVQSTLKGVNKMKEKIKYAIIRGKWNEQGAGNGYFVQETKTLKEALKIYSNIIFEEKRTLNDWHLQNNEFIEITLDKIPYFIDENDFEEEITEKIETLKICHIYKNGKIERN